jgi:hypothetical protein
VRAQRARQAGDDDVERCFELDVAIDGCGVGDDFCEVGYW